MLEQFTPDDRPDWPEEFDPHVEALGRPESVHRTAPGSASRRILLGLGLLVLGGIINYVYWVLIGIVLVEKFLLLLLFGTPIYGLILLYSAWKDKGVWVLAYPVGLLRWQRGEVTAFPWAEVKRLTFAKVQKAAALTFPPTADGRTVAAIPLEGAGSVLFGCRLTLTREDGTEGEFASTLTDFAPFGQRVQAALFSQFWEPWWQDFQEGRSVDVGAFRVDRKGLHRAKDHLPWGQFSGARINGGKFVIARAGKWRPWLELNVHEWANLHVIWALVVTAHEDCVGPVTEE